MMSISLFYVFLSVFRGCDVSLMLLHEMVDPYLAPRDQSAVDLELPIVKLSHTEFTVCSPLKRLAFVTSTIQTLLI